MRAVRTGNKSEVMSGLAWGGDPNSRDSRGWTLLHHAVYKVCCFFLYHLFVFFWILLA